jgi:uncharacterized paraquat-inducible protein A
MIRCQCPKCQNQFQVPDKSIGDMEACPDCRFHLEVPGLKAQGSEAAPPGRIIAACPQCKMKFLVPLDQAGTTRACPACDQTVTVPAWNWEQQEEKWRRGMMLLAVFGLLLFLCAFAAGWLNPILDHFNPAPNSTFGTVGLSIGKTVIP